MTNQDKKEIVELICAGLKSCKAECELGISKETAAELISFAETWKTCRKSLLVGIVTVTIGGIIAALWAGVKFLARQ